MKVFKFGGASVKDPGAIKNLDKIMDHYKDEPIVIVVSAMGKTTNALEEILETASNKKTFGLLLKNLVDFHLEIINALFVHDEKNLISDQIEKIFEDITIHLKGLKTENYNMIYDFIVSKGEIASSMIVNAYFNKTGKKSNWIDARKFIRTDSTFREGKVDWEFTCSKINSLIPALLNQNLAVTQGFIGADINGNTTTLGREGSDYTAAIIGSCMKVAEVVIWKDVDGILNADPKRISNAKKYEQLPYQEAAEMAYYGASVIHPKTIKPLANKNIKLWVRPFNDVKAVGTCIHHCEVNNLEPAIIFKPNQCLLSFRVKDFTFINEKNLSLIFHVLDALNIKINVMQNSAISFSICVDNQDYKIKTLLDKLKSEFDIFYNENLELVTIKNYTNQLLHDLNLDKDILLEQRSRNNYQIVVRNQ